MSDTFERGDYMTKFKVGDIVQTMPKFEKGDIVQIEYRSSRAIEDWMSGRLKMPGPGDLGVVKFSSPDSLVADSMHMQQQVTVTFPMFGTFGVHSSNLKLVQKAGADAAPDEAEI